jgi:hypothetical protein
MAPQLTISSLAQPGSQIISWVVADAPTSALKSIKSIVNENTASTSIKETSHPILDNSNNLITNIVMTDSLLPIGKTTFVRLVFTYADADQTTILSNTLVLSNNQIPNTPILALATNIRAEDSGVSFKLSQYVSPVSGNDGYSKITKVVVLLSKVNGTQADDLQMLEVIIPPVDLTTNPNPYSNWMLVPAQLDNNNQYEIAIAVHNAVGVSLLSNTLTFQPKDTPDEIMHVFASSLLSNQKRQEVTLNDANGDIVLYWTKNADYNELLGSILGKAVSKYTITETEYDYVTTNNVTALQPISTRTIDLVVPSHVVGQISGASFELSAPEEIDSVYYPYQYVIPGSPSRLGKKYTYTVTAVNVNGDGPVSVASDFVVAFKIANAQPFELIHNSVISTATGTPMDIYTGEMSMKITTLASLNGGQGYPVPNTQFMYPVGTVINDEQLVLNVTTDAQVPIQIFTGLVTFKQNVTTSTTGTGANAVTTYTPTGIYNLNFDDVDTDSDSAGMQSLNNALVYGTKYKFELFRQSKNPTISSDIFSSQVTTISRTKFKRPNAISKIQNFPIYDDLTPVTGTIQGETKQALRLIFDQLSTPDLNGLEVFRDSGPDGNDIMYYAFQNSTIVLGLDPIIHNYDQVGPNQFIIALSSTGLVSQYIRTRVYNAELGIYINGEESSPAASETAISSPSAVLSATINKVSANQITVGFTRQTLAALGGSPSSACQNRIIIMEDGASIPAADIVVPHNTTSPYTSAQITLTTGKSHAVFIVAERVYTKTAHDSPSNDPLNVDATFRFNNVLIRSNYYTDNFLMNGIPTAPTTIELLPSDKQLEVLYDEPTVLNGVSPTTITYHFFMNKEAADFPYFNTATQTLQASVSDVAGSSIATLVKAFTTKAVSNDRTNAELLLNSETYYFCMRAVGRIGGNSLTKTSYSQTVSTGFINGITVNSVVALTSNPSVIASTVNGELSPGVAVVIDNDIPSVSGIDISPSASVLNITLNKDTTGTASDLLIILDNNDALGAGDLAIPAFDTRSLRTSSAPNGLFNLENYFQGGTIATNAPGFSIYNFTRTSNNNILKYNITIPNLVNGRTYAVSVRFIKNYGSVSEPLDVFGPATTIARAPEAPPTIVQNATFAVADKVIVLDWAAPSNSGGANIGGNSLLQYRVKLFSSSGTELGFFDTPNLTYTISSYLVNSTSTALTNGTDYKVTISAFYNKLSDGSTVISDPVQANSASGNIIKPNVAPVGVQFTSSSLTVGTSNTITGSFNLPSVAETTNYPVLRYDVYAIQKSSQNSKVLIQSFATTSGTTQGLTQTVIQFTAGSTVTLAPISSFPTSGVTPNTMVHVKPLNGFTYEIAVEAIPNYTYAQAAPTKKADATPYGNVSITSALVKTGTSNKVYTVIANVNGSGPINNIVALGKGASSNAILVNNLSAGTLPSILYNGDLNNTTTYVAAGQTANFEVAFLAANGAVNDILVVVVTPNGSDTIVIPVSGGFFN